MTERKDLPRLERGKDLSRIFAFTDGVFAIAITLLVLQITVPEGLKSNQDLINRIDDLLPDLFAFTLSFFVIGMSWIRHHRLMRMVREYDRKLMMLTMFYLAWVVLLPFSSQLIGEYGSKVTLSTVFYVLNLAMVSFGFSLMIRSILNDHLSDPKYRWDLELSFKSSSFTVAVFVLTAPVAYLLGPWTLLIWFPLMSLDPWQRRRDQIYKSN